MYITLLSIFREAYMSTKEKEETRAKIMAAAKEEFSEYGFEKASLRRICSKAGCTTGAIYFFFKDKDELFCEIVNHVLIPVQTAVTEHILEDKENSSHILVESDFEHEIALADKLVDILYSHREEAMILLTKSAGSSLEKAPDMIIAELEKEYGELATVYARQEGKKVDEYMVHWLSHLHVEAYIHLVTHEKDVKAAKKRTRKIMLFLVRGWLDCILM